MVPDSDKSQYNPRQIIGIFLDFTSRFFPRFSGSDRIRRSSM